MDLALICRTCGVITPNERLSPPSWAWIGAFATVQWAEEVPPAVGSRHTVQVHYPFRASSEAPFWALFQPAMSALNGWEEAPGELASSGVAKCQLLEILEQTPHQATLRVEVLDTLLFRQAARQLSLDERWELPNLLANLRGSRVVWDDLTLFDVNAEGDLGEWLLCQEHGDGHVVVAWGEWSFHTNFVYVGHRPLSAEDWRVLRERSAGSSADPAEP